MFHYLYSNSFIVSKVVCLFLYLRTIYVSFSFDYLSLLDVNVNLKLFIELFSTCHVLHGIISVGHNINNNVHTTHLCPLNLLLAEVLHRHLLQVPGN